jgi:hypothetical protein
MTPNQPTGDEVREAAERLRRINAGESFQIVYHELVSPPGDMAAMSYRVLDDRRELATEYLCEHPADEGDRVNESWLVSIGFQFEREDEVHSGSLGLLFVMRRIDQFDYLEWMIDGDPKYQIKQPRTRGDVRRLATALGITLKERG